MQDLQLQSKVEVNISARLAAAAGSLRLSAMEVRPSSIRRAPHQPAYAIRWRRGPGQSLPRMAAIDTKSVRCATFLRTDSSVDA